jgi:hypothetical protein
MGLNHRAAGGTDDVSRCATGEQQNGHSGYGNAYPACHVFFIPVKLADENRGSTLVFAVSRIVSALRDARERRPT